MCYVEQIFSEARRQGASAFVVEAGFAPRWVEKEETFGLQDEVQSDVLTAFLFRTMPSGSQARLAMGQPVEFQAQVQGSEWMLRAESTEHGFFVHISPAQSIDASMNHCLLEDEAGLEDTSKFRVASALGSDKSELAPPPSCAAAKDKSPMKADTYEQMQLSQEAEQAGANGPSGQEYRIAQHWSEEQGAGIPGYVEDTPFGLASGAMSLGLSDLPPQGRVFDVTGSLILVNDRAVRDAALEHLNDPWIEVTNHSSLFDTYPAIDTLSRGACVSVDVEDPSVWFSWVMRRLEQGCTVVVLCRASGELGAMRVLCGLNPEVPSSRWLAEHRRVFLPDLESVTSLFVTSFERAATA